MNRRNFFFHRDNDGEFTPGFTSSMTERGRNQRVFSTFRFSRRLIRLANRERDGPTPRKPRPFHSVWFCCNCLFHKSQFCITQKVCRRPARIAFHTDPLDPRTAIVIGRRPPVVSRRPGPRRARRRQRHHQGRRELDWGPARLAREEEGVLLAAEATATPQLITHLDPARKQRPEVRPAKRKRTPKGMQRERTRTKLVPIVIYIANYIESREDEKRRKKVVGPLWHA